MVNISVWARTFSLYHPMIITPTSYPLDYRHTREEDCLKFFLLWQTGIEDNSVQLLRSIKRELRSNNKLVQIKRRENCKATSRHWPQCAKWFLRYHTHVVYGMGQELLFWKLKNLNKLLVFEALYP